MSFIVRKLVDEKSCDGLCVEMGEEFFEILFCMQTELLLRFVDKVLSNAYEIRIEKTLYLIAPHAVIGAA